MSDYHMPDDVDILPCSVPAEKTILGAVLLDSDRMLEIAGILERNDFYLESHAQIFESMVKVCERDGVVDVITLAQHLTDKGGLSSVGGMAYLFSLTEGLPRRPEIDNYLRIVRDKAISRRVLAFCEALSGRAYSSDVSGLENASWGISALSAIADDSKHESGVQDAATMADDAEYRLLDCPSDAEVIPTGLRDLDEKCGGGVRRGELWIIGASPSRGKTTLARQIVANAVTRQIPAYVHSGEMTKESWFDVTACLLANLPAWKTREPRLLNLADKECLRTGIRELKTLPFYISDAGGIHLDKLIYNATREVRQHKIELLAVDYAQIINAGGKDDRQRVTAVAQRLRLFAKDENVGVLLLSQSPRPEGRAINARPTMFSLKESGALEEAGHVVLLPYRPIDTDSGMFTGHDELIIGKNRWGAIGSVNVNLNGEYLRFDGR